MKLGSREWGWGGSGEELGVCSKYTSNTREKKSLKSYIRHGRVHPPSNPSTWEAEH